MSFSPFAGEKTILVPILSPHDTLIPLSPSLSLAPLSVSTFFSASKRLIQGLRAVCRLHKVIILRSPRGCRVRRREEAGRRRGGGVLGPTWKLISNEPRVKPKLIRFRLAWPAALTNLKNFGNANFSTRD